jgi:hypothetical protein
MATVVLLESVSQPVTYGIGWGSLALINAGLAQGKNHSGTVWFVASIFLGPIATLLIVAVLEKQ